MKTCKCICKHAELLLRAVMGCPVKEKAVIELKNRIPVGGHQRWESSSLNALIELYLPDSVLSHYNKIVS